MEFAQDLFVLPSLRHGPKDWIVPADAGSILVILGLGVAHLIELGL